MKRGLRSCLVVAVAVASILPSCRRDTEIPAPSKQGGPGGAAGGREEVLAGLSDPIARSDAFRRGVALGLFASTRDAGGARRIYRDLLDELRGIGATDVALIVEWTQADVAATEIAPSARATPGDALLRHVILDARERALRVFLMPILGLERRRPHEWRGALKPRDLDAWWASYRDFILHYAALGAECDIDLFSVGSELVTTEAQVERWRSLIAGVRNRFEGQLTYSANWDHFEPVRFWDALDVVGVTAYHPLSQEMSPTDEALLRTAWAPFTHRLRAFARERNLRYVLTEVGYPSHEAAAVRPWDHTSTAAADPALQARLYRVLFETWQADARLDGIFVWNWFGIGGPTDTSYTPRGKPSERVLRHWYERSRRR